MSPLFSLQVRDETEFVDRLGCGDVAGVKVLSIFGNTGDGKSHTLNHILFGGETVFYTSKSPSSCTVGVWAAYDPKLSLVALDTEGLLGAAANQNQRMRLLLKVILAVAGCLHELAAGCVYTKNVHHSLQFTALQFSCLTCN